MIPGLYYLVSSFIFATTTRIVPIRQAAGKVFEIYTKSHFHDLMQDTAVGARPASVIAFYNESNECMQSFQSLKFGDNGFPEVDSLFFGQYEMSTHKERVWYDYETQALDLAETLGINAYINDHSESCQCPLLVWIPATYAHDVGGWYMETPSTEGVQVWDPASEPDWRKWVWNLLKVKVRVIQKEPYDLDVTVSAHPARKSFVTDSGTEGDREFHIEAMESHVEFDAYVGDSIFISGEPVVPKHVLEANKAIRPTPDPPINGISKIFPCESRETNLIKLNVIHFGHSWGFDAGIRNGVDSNIVKRRHATTCMSHTRNLVIPMVLPRFGKLGFTKMKMPPGLHERLKRYYRNYYDKRVAESWDKVGTQINYDEIQTHMISLDHNFAERNSIANDVMRPILEEWGGQTGLEFSAFYGIREYSRGAVLRNHVDRVDTHVFSAIMQIGQSEMDEDWTLEVFAYDGKRVQIALKPGELALYESHTLIHGRPKPLNGTLFSNAFVHFKPRDWPWKTSVIWQSDIAKDILKKLHIRGIHDIYR